MIDLGTGPPVVVIPGVQGRWEFTKPAVDALARRARVVTFSLCGEPGSGRSVDPSLGFDNFIAQIDAAMDHARLDAAAICGVSFGGLIAASYAARRPSRVRALILVSALPPAWQPNHRIRRYLRAPRLLAPLFFLQSPWRLRSEFAVALPDWRQRWACAYHQLGRVVTAPLSPRLMAQRISFLQGVDVATECQRIVAPTLLVVGEPDLDKVVPVALTREYLRLIPHAVEVVLERTGHLGLITRSERFAEIVGRFVERMPPADQLKRASG